MANPTKNYCIKLKAPNDVNGNPRHIVLIYDLQGQLLAVEDLGYRSWWQACEELGYGKPVLLGTFPTTVEHYKYLKKVKE